MVTPSLPRTQMILVFVVEVSMGRAAAHAARAGQIHGRAMVQVLLEYFSPELSRARGHGGDELGSHNASKRQVLHQPIVFVTRRNASRNNDVVRSNPGMKATFRYDIESTLFDRIQE